MILPKSDAVPYETTGGLDTVAIRMPSHPAAQKLIEYSGGYIAAPVPILPETESSVAKYVVEDMMGRIDAIIDGGEVGIGLESTIIDLTVSPPQILRPGIYHPGKAQCGVGNGGHRCHDPAGRQWTGPQGAWYEIQTLCPQGKTHHCGRYAGTGERIYQQEAAADHAAGEKTRYYRNGRNVFGYTADVVKSVGSRRDEDSIARHLYTILREFDDEGVTKIYSEGFSTDGFGQAIMNRLLKAAGHKVVKL